MKKKRGFTADGGGVGGAVRTKRGALSMRRFFLLLALTTGCVLHDEKRVYKRATQRNSDA